MGVRHAILPDIAARRFKRARDPIQLGKLIIDIATGQVEEPYFQPLAALHPVQTWEDTKLLLVHALGHVRDLIPRSIRVIANGPLAPFVQCYAGRRAERPAEPRVASSGSTDRSADVIRHRHRQR